MLRALPASLAAALAAAGCGSFCPSQPSGCVGHTSVLIPLPEGIPEAYELTVATRRDEYEYASRCLLIFPPPNDWPGSLPASCVGDAADVLVRPDLEAGCETTIYPTTGTECHVARTGFTLVVTARTAVDELSLAFAKGGVAYEPVSIVTDYHTVYPDGPSCPGSCEVSEQSLEYRSFFEPATPAE